MTSLEPLASPRLGLGALGIAIRVVLAIAVLVLANLAVAGAMALLGAIPGVADIMQEATWLSLGVLVLVQAVSTIVVVGAVWLWLRLVERRALSTAGWRWDRRSAPALALGAAASACLLLGTIALLPPAGPVTGDWGEAPVVMSLVALVSQAFLLQAIPEELLFRGWLLTAMRARPVVAVVATTLAFTVIHLVSSGGQESVLEHVLYLAQPLGFSLLAVGLLLWTRSLWSAIGVHGGFHLGNAVVTVALPEVDAVLTWVAVGGVQALAGLALVVTALRRGRGIAP